MLDENRECVVLYAEKCFRCSHLVDGAPKTFNRCHFSAGNVDCPAVAVRIITSGKIRQYVKRMEAAQEAKDAPTIAAIWAEIAAETPEVRRRLFDVLGG